MSDKVIVITGASRGIGAATAMRAAGAGYNVCVNYQSNRDAAQSIVDTIMQGGGKAMALQADVSSEADIVRLFQDVDQQLGPVNALVNNAGILLPQMHLNTMTAERINRVFATNVTGSLLCAREAIQRMAISAGGQGGAIVNLSSIAATLGAPFEYIDYAASKGAVDTMTIGMARELAQESIRVNAVRPGIIDTDIHASGGEPDRIKRVSPSIPMQRAGTAEEVANAILYLLSDEARYVTGAILDVSGGR